MADDSDLVEVVRVGTEPDAHRAVELLLLRGIGATWERTEPEPEAGAYAVRVVAADVVRARELLGVDSTLEVEATQARAEAGRRRQQYLVFGLVALAFVVIPLLAFWVAYAVGS